MKLGNAPLGLWPALKNTRIEESYRLAVPGQGHEQEL